MCCAMTLTAILRTQRSVTFIWRTSSSTPRFLRKAGSSILKAEAGPVRKIKSTPVSRVTLNRPRKRQAMKKSSTTVSATLSSHALFGQVPVTPTISVRATEDDPWRDAPGQAQTFAAEFRYVKIHYDFAASDAHSLIQISDLNLKLAVKHKVDSGKGQAHADEPHGAWVAFNLTFIDVQGAPNVQPMLRAPTYAVVDFKDEPYPKGFYVLLYDIRGRRISGPFSWMARGV